MNRLNRIEVCFSPALFRFYKDKNAIVIVVDPLRATSAICTAFENGVKKLIPVGTVDEARAYKNNGYLVAAERDGYVLDFADFGNSPFNFTPERVKGKTIVYSTTNGTQAIQTAGSCYKVIIGSFLNLTAICKWAIQQDRNIIILCAAWKNKFNLEDSVLAGAIVEQLLESKKYYSICDSALAAMDLWTLAKTDLVGYINKAAQRSRLRDKGLDDVIEYCHTPDSTEVIPVLKENYIVELRNTHHL
ncbi:MAG: 2-phosphosulfolactate phosphatase [Bacteroidetes bacterium]|nr:2-phosphosulfolactate phosphatase [Bacteroidota bacterium]